ncbi:MAG TPA: sigma-70 family RNA polymerase sigma factor [Candidatus Sulfotelmatobacter sp.]|jgi:RNA polymerase sigma-70 factor (ECF subfamily)|nr:sigma-70 family RNA polymerase sigma factor [Candidatus Sulfotelmatobacter sp.]
MASVQYVGAEYGTRLRPVLSSLGMRKEIEQAVTLLKKNEPQAIERALELLQKTVFSFSMKVCGQREDAEDTMQEVLVKAIPYLPRFGSPRALLVWLYKVAKNRCLMSRRKSKFAPKQELSLDELMPDRRELAMLAKEGPVNPESLAIRSQQARRLREVIQQLPPRYRIILVLRDMEGLTDEEVGDITGLRPGNVRVRLHRARLFVRKKIAGRHQNGRNSKQAVRQPQPVDSHRAEKRLASCKDLFAQLSNYLDEEMDDSLCDKLEEHLDGCEPCKAFLASLEATIEHLRTIPADALNRVVAAKIRRDLLRQYPYE